MSVIVNQLSLTTPSTTSYTSSSVECDSFVAFSTYVYPSSSGTLAIQMSMDGVMWSTISTTPLVGLQAVSNKIVIATRYLRYNITFSVASTAQVQCYLFRK